MVINWTGDNVAWTMAMSVVREGRDRSEKLLGSSIGSIYDWLDVEAKSNMTW